MHITWIFFLDGTATSVRNEVSALFVTEWNISCPQSIQETKHWNSSPDQSSRAACFQGVTVATDPN
jgi:hypothetical protein